MSTNDAIIAALQVGLRHSLDTKEHADLILCCTDGTTFSAHKVILAGQSEFFRKALKPDSFKEGREGRIDIAIGDSAIIGLMINFMYCFDYDEKSYSEGLLLANARIHEVAEYYIMPQLKSLAVTKFLLAMEMKDKWKPKDFVGAVTQFYGAPVIDAEVRVSVLTAVIDNHKILANDPDFEKLLSKMPELGKDLTLVMLPSYARLHKATGCVVVGFKCHGCGRTWAYSGPKPRSQPTCPSCGIGATVTFSE
ncbi:hypothetical protein FKW77_005131 [Venturia effusa]|uniref:BTB domain-containing protein n=1 Tax=Venturia effusa TaxID=50376 RepID=A0A517LQ52_9PEZI|nr:hypothetical protein FKW77_005131 [Venturia effusa]